jgi:hypothetical protein
MLGVGGALVRAVTHLDVSHSDAITAASVISQVVDGLTRGTIDLPPDQPGY